MDIINQQKTHSRLDLDSLLTDNIDYVSHVFGIYIYIYIQNN